MQEWKDTPQMLKEGHSALLANDKSLYAILQSVFPSLLLSSALKSCHSIIVFSVVPSSSQGVTLTYPYHQASAEARFQSSSNHRCVSHNCIFQRTFAKSKSPTVRSEFSSPEVFEFDNSCWRRGGYTAWLLSTKSCPSLHIKNSHFGNYLAQSTHRSCLESQNLKPPS